MALNLEDKQTVKQIVYEVLDERDKIITIGRSDLNELKYAVKDLEVEQKGMKVDINDLKAIVKELAIAQFQSEKRLDSLTVKVEELAEAQKQTNIAIKELTQAQKRTEEELHELVGEHKKMRTDFGNFSDSVGFSLEDRSYKALPELLKRDFGIIVKTKLKRQYINDNKGEFIEINIVGPASRDGQDIMIIGESKSQLSKNKVDEFIRKKLNRLQGVFNEIFPLMITYMISEPDVEDYAKQNGITLYYSYDF